jgi:ABC-type uncharacterized transport system auxiliary subunit
MFLALNPRITTSALALVAAGMLAACSDSVTAPTSVAAVQTAAVFNAAVSAVPQEITLLPPTNARFPGAHGKATFKTDGELQLLIEIEGMARRIVVFYLDNQRLGARFVDSQGAARLDLRGVEVPASVAGKMVQVKTGLGVLVVEGRFQ